MRPGFAPSATPFAPKITFSTISVSGRLRKSQSTWAARSAGDFAARAPCPSET